MKIFKCSECAGCADCMIIDTDSAPSNPKVCPFNLDTTPKFVETDEYIIIHGGKVL